MQNSTKYCIWLTYESELLESTINNLSEKFNTPIFQAHCTIIGKTDVPLVQLKSAIVNAVDPINLQEFTVSKIEYRDDYWMSYYLTFYEKQIVSGLRKRLLEALGIQEISDFYPHISLMYCSLSEDDKVKINVPIHKGDVIVAKSIQITECECRVESWKPVFELILK